MKPITLKLPGGVQVPDGTTTGQTFHVMATMTMGKNGMATLTEIDGEPLGKPDDSDAANLNADDDASQPDPSVGGIRGLLAGAAGGQ